MEYYKKRLMVFAATRDRDINLFVPEFNIAESSVWVLSFEQEVTIIKSEIIIIKCFFMFLNYF
jgi:hypothetical protein